MPCAHLTELQESRTTSPRARPRSSAWRLDMRFLFRVFSAVPAGLALRNEGNAGGRAVEGPAWDGPAAFLAAQADISFCAALPRRGRKGAPALLPGLAMPVRGHATLALRSLTPRVGRHNSGYACLGSSLMLHREIPCRAGAAFRSSGRSISCDSTRPPMHVPNTTFACIQTASTQVTSRAAQQNRQQTGRCFCSQDDTSTPCNVARQCRATAGYQRGPSSPSSRRNAVIDLQTCLQASGLHGWKGRPQQKGWARAWGGCRSVGPWADAVQSPAHTPPLQSTEAGDLHQRRQGAASQAAAACTLQGDRVAPAAQPRLARSAAVRVAQPAAAGRPRHPGRHARHPRA